MIARLRDGRVVNIPFVSCDGNVPIFWIDRVHDDLTSLFVDLLIALIRNRNGSTSSIPNMPMLRLRHQFQPMKTFESGIDVALDTILLSDGVYHYRRWNYETVPHAIVVGPTGSGKTFLVKLVLARIGLRVPNSSVVGCDFKLDDFHFLLGSSNHHGFLDCLSGLEKFHDAFLARQRGVDKCRDFRLLVVDEWTSLLNTLEKKESEAARTKLATLLMLGRSFNCHVLISQQRADAENFAKGARDNFGLVVALGNISKESAAMFGFDRDKMEPVSGVGNGYMLTNGTDMATITVPMVQDVKRMEAYIRRVVARPL